MKRRCSNVTCVNHALNAHTGIKSGSIVRKGTFYRQCDRRRITRYRCNACNTQFSSSTFDENYRQKRREINQKVHELLCSGISQRRLAQVLDVNPKTVIRKFRFLAAKSRVEHRLWLSQFKRNQISHIQFDDLETSEHSKCKPLSVTLAVHAKTREIIGFQVSKMPAKGLLSGIALKKYGYRKDERQTGWNELFESLKPVTEEKAYFESDENPHYPKYLKLHFKSASHEQHPGKRGAITGQGELKKIHFDEGYLN